MTKDNLYYQPPESHDEHLKKMGLWLAIFFSSLVLAVIVFVLNAHRVVVYLPFAVEERFVSAHIELFQPLLKDKEPTPEKQQINQYLQKLVDELAKASEVPEDYIIKVHYIDSDVKNAFATLGGHIFVFRGLMQTLADENSLAMVIAHEVAHIKHRDPLSALSRGLAIQLIYSFITGEYSGGSTLADMGGELGMSFFSREQEQAADIEAINAIYRYYGHVGGYDRFFAAMATEESSDEDKIPEWMSTHPDLEHRIDYLSRYIEENGWPQGPAESIPEHIVISLETLDSAENDESHSAQ